MHHTGETLSAFFASLRFFFVRVALRLCVSSSLWFLGGLGVLVVHPKPIKSQNLCYPVPASGKIAPERSAPQNLKLELETS
jgi:hypothetical protein